MGSQFFVTCRLRPASAFEGFESVPIKFGEGYELHFRGDLAWIGFEASSADWEDKRDKGLSRLRTYLSAVALVKQYAFDADPVQWIEIGREDREAKYVLGRLSSDEPVAQAKPPKVTAEDFYKAREYAILAEISPFFKRAMIDYSVALGFLREGVIFLSRSLEAVESYFGASQPAPPSGRRKQKSRDVMRKALCLPSKELNRFYTIANETTLARHAKKPAQFRAATVEELRFCVVFCRTALDRFASYLLYENRNILGQEMPLPNNFNPEQEFTKKNASFRKALRDILAGDLK